MPTMIVSIVPPPGTDNVAREMPAFFDVDSSPPVEPSERKVIVRSRSAS